MKDHKGKLILSSLLVLLRYRSGKWKKIMMGEI